VAFHKVGWVFRDRKRPARQVAADPQMGVVGLALKLAVLFWRAVHEEELL